MPIFSNSVELIGYADRFLYIRIRSLEEDITHCLTGINCHYAPFPALLYCFSTIDLLGALYKGEAGKNPITLRNPNTSKNFIEYMMEFMGYSKEEADLLQKIFRHKIVHLAEPKPIVNYNIENDSDNISWRYIRSSKYDHLTIKKYLTKRYDRITQNLTIGVDYLFTISIVHLVEDIEKSVNNPSGYLDKLRSNTNNMQTNFEEALKGIYDPYL